MMRAYNDSRDNGQKTPSDGSRFLKVPSVDKYRRMSCFTYTSTGSCAYGSRCVFLHDPRVTCYSEEEIRFVSTKQKPYGSGLVAKDTFYWPDMDKFEVSRTVDVSTNLPACCQPYTIPESFKHRYEPQNMSLGYAGVAEKKEGMHNLAIYSLWNHFVSEMMLVKARHHGQVQSQSHSQREERNDMVPAVKRLPIFVRLSQGLSSVEGKGSYEKAQSVGRGATSAIDASLEEEEEEAFPALPLPLPSPSPEPMAGPKAGPPSPVSVTQTGELSSVPAPIPTSVSWLDACSQPHGAQPQKQRQGQGQRQRQIQRQGDSGMHARGLSPRQSLARLGPSCEYHHQPHWLGAATGPDWFSESALLGPAMRVKRGMLPRVDTPNPRPRPVATTPTPVPACNGDSSEGGDDRGGAGSASVEGEGEDFSVEGREGTAGYGAA